MHAYVIQSDYLFRFSSNEIQGAPLCKQKTNNRWINTHNVSHDSWSTDVPIQSTCSATAPHIYLMLTFKVCLVNKGQLPLQNARQSLMRCCSFLLLCNSVHEVHMKTLLTNCASYVNMQIYSKPVRSSVSLLMLQAWRVTTNLGLDTSTLQLHLKRSAWSTGGQLWATTKWRSKASEFTADLEFNQTRMLIISLEVSF